MLISKVIYERIKANKEVTENEFRELLTDASDAYYISTNLIMEDDVFDYLKDKFIQIYKYNPVEIGTNKSLKGFIKVRHSIPMGSLEEFNTKKDVEEEIKKWGNKYADENVFCTAEKLDGLSVDVYFNSGSLEQALTRGDGDFGDDITRNVLKMSSINSELPVEITGHIRGEIILPIPLWKEHYPHFANPRSGAVGLTKRLDGEGCEHLQIRFFKIYTEDVIFTSEKESLDFIKQKLKLLTPRYWKTNIQTLIALHKKYESELREKADYLLDGLVVSIDSIKRQNEILENPLLPEYARKYKFESEKATTQLIGVRNQVGRTGAITPLAILEPVVCGGTLISKPTLHNYEEIERLGIKIGDIIIVVRSKDVIPKIIGIASKDPEGIEIKIPIICPVCKTPLERVDTIIYCTNEDCDARVLRGILHWLGVLKIKNLGVKLTEALINNEKLRKIPDLYNLKIEDISEIDGQGVKNATKILREINSKKEISIAKLLAGINIKNLSIKRAEILEDNFGTLNKILNLEKKEILSLEGFEDKLSTSVYEGINNKKDLITEILHHIKIEEKMSGGKLEGKTFCFSGFRNNKLEEEITKNGGRINSGVSKKLIYLVVKNKNSTTEKIKKARSYGTEIIEPDDLDKMLHKGLF